MLSQKPLPAASQRDCGNTSITWAATGTTDSPGALQEQQMWWAKPCFSVTVTLLMLLVFTEGFCLSQLILAFYLILYIFLSSQDLIIFSVHGACQRLQVSLPHKPKSTEFPHFCGGEALVKELLWFKWLMGQAGFLLPTCRLFCCTLNSTHLFSMCAFHPEPGSRATLWLPNSIGYWMQTSPNMDFPKECENHLMKILYIMK